MSVNLASDGNDDGTNFGRSDEKIGFYGLATPIVKPTLAAAAVSTAAAAAGASSFGFSTASQAAAIVTLVNEIKTDLTALGLVG